MVLCRSPNFHRLVFLQILVITLPGSLSKLWYRQVVLILFHVLFCYFVVMEPLLPLITCSGIQRPGPRPGAPPHQGPPASHQSGWHISLWGCGFQPWQSIRTSTELWKNKHASTLLPHDPDSANVGYSPGVYIFWKVDRWWWWAAAVKNHCSQVLMTDNGSVQYRQPHTPG